MKQKLFIFWEKGYLYIFIGVVLYCFYGLFNKIGIYDWQKEIAYFQYIKISFTSFNSWPLFWWNIPDNIQGYPAIAHSSIFIGNPETMLFSPFIFLIKFLDVIPFIKLLIFIHFIIGIFGVLALRNRLKWNNFQFRTYLSLFIFSPIIIQHLAVGYTPWINLFLFPWLIYFIADENLLSSSLGISGIIGLTLLQGGIHVGIWFTIFFVIYSFAFVYFKRNWRYLFRLLIIIIFILLLALIRIYTTFYAYKNFYQGFQIGYTPLNFLFWALIPPILVYPFDILFIGKIWFGVPSYDGGVFWGIFLIMIIIMILNYRIYNEMDKRYKGHLLNYDSLFFSASMMFILSFFNIYKIIIKSINSIVSVPFIEGMEKYPYRLIILSFLVFSIMIGEYSQNIWSTIKNWIGNFIISKIFLKIFNFVKYLSIIFFISLSIFLIINLIFSKIILSKILLLVKSTYFGSNNQLFSKLMQGKEHFPIENYLIKAETLYRQFNILILFILIISFLMFLFLQNRMKIQDFFKKYPLALYEMLLTIPLFFASLMWFLIAISVSVDKCQTDILLSPKILTTANLPESEPDMIVTPEKLIIFPKNITNKTRDILLNINTNDYKFLKVVSNNATLSILNGFLLIKPSNSSPIIISLEYLKYKFVLYITILSWVGLIGTFIINKIMISKKH